ncbi:hypothetical protein PCANB_002432 [Pneumocystis canis]|nr:hypothetical protein PCANB_002432 [Pneumocystis canis]
MYTSEDGTPEAAQESSSPGHGLSDEFHGDVYEDSNTSFDETKFSVPELDSSPLRSSVTQYSDAFSHKGQDLEELGAIPSTLFDSPTSKNGAETTAEGHLALKSTRSGRLSSTSLATKSSDIWQDSSPATLPPLYTAVNYARTRPTYVKSTVEKDALRISKTLTEHASQSAGFSATMQHCHEPSSNNFKQNQETDKSSQLFEYPFTESLSSYNAKHRIIRQNIMDDLCSSFSEKWVSLPSRYLRVTNLPKTIETWMLKEIFEGIMAGNLRENGSVIVGFYDLRDCIKIQKQLRHYRFFNNRYLEAQFYSKAALMEMFKEGAMFPFLSENEGEILISLQGSGDISKTVLFSLLSSYGDIRTIKSSLSAMKKAVICEYFDIRDAALAVNELNDRVVQDNKLHVTFYKSSFVSWKVVSDKLQHFQDENIILDQFKSLDISENGLNNITDEYLVNHHESKNTLSHSKPLPFFSNKKSLNGSIMDRSNSMPYYPLQDGKSLYTIQSPDISSETDYYKCNTIRKPASTQLKDNSYVYLDNSLSNIDHYGNSSAIKETFDESKIKSCHSTFIPGSTPSQRRVYSANMKRSITHDGVWMENSPSMTERLSLNLKYSFDVLKTANNSNSGANSVTEKNRVDYDRIARGLDMRTTIMIKNIPNKFTQKMLQEYIDVTNSKTYDFLYLRIDFKNRCNVGYAFVNFIDPISIVTFGQARVGTKWNRFHSDKICDISYANIQGKECLIEKFRNSCVMDEDPSYRPKIFISHGPATGEEQEFPAPNNPRRKLRSIVSAQQFGLFPPVGSRAPWSIREEHAFL